MVGDPGKNGGGGRRVRRRRLREQTILGWAFSSPVLLIIGVLVLYPLIRGLLMSFQSLDLSSGGDGSFVGLRNYSAVLRDPQTEAAALHTLGYVGCAVVIEIVGGLMVALALNRPFRGRGLVFAAVILPWALPRVVSGVLWSRIFNPDSGLLNSALIQLHLTHTNHAWFDNPYAAIFLISLVHVWGVLPLTTLILLAGLQGIPANIYAAAELDGAGAVRQFRAMTLPLLRPALGIALTTGTIAAFAIFDEIYVLAGSAYSTRSMMTQVYLTTFSGGDFGQGSALAYLLTLATAVFGIAYVRRLGRAAT
jgi:multiple sugar transport system permease protein